MKLTGAGLLMYRHSCVAHSRYVNRMMLDRSHLVSIHFKVCLTNDGAAWRVLVLDDVSRTSLKGQTGKV